MSRSKSDCNEFRAFIAGMVQIPGRDPSGVGWPLYLFHITDVQNAASILRSGVLLSRESAEAQGVMTSDNAHHEIISQTSRLVRSSVRLYFRPRTPTFFRNEGFRPLDTPEAAHCPVPVALLFDSASVLCLPNTQFSNGSLARHDAVLGQTVEDFKSLPFDRIYHDRSLYRYDPLDRDDIIFRRQAEVIVPNQLQIRDLLRYVFVRSIAERETLYSLLTNSEMPTTSTPIRVNTQSPLFFKRWTFVQRVFISENHVSLVMNADTEAPGPFFARFEFVEEQIGRSLKVESRLETTVGTIRQPIPTFCQRTPFLFRFYLDSCLAYQNSLNPRQSISITR